MANAAMKSTLTGLLLCAILGDNEQSRGELWQNFLTMLLGKHGKERGVNPHLPCLDASVFVSPIIMVEFVAPNKSHGRIEVERDEGHGRPIASVTSIKTRFRTVGFFAGFPVIG